ncbi:MAG: TIGR04283 family arsenosugar biosynthesis glycosyltransferase [Planctomycetaceae bacterium]|nr:TIGR04283 family arsenosugar biosynthesis glycosyltransferase [Planctomycetaceae bacterium]
MRLTAVIPTLNEAPHIAGAIASARTAEFDEIIVVDGGSTDDTVARASAADIVLSSPPSRATQQNLGAAAATGDVLCFLHADCRPHPDSGRAIRAALADETIIGGCFAQHIDALGWRYRLLEWGNRQRVLWRQMAYGDQGIFLCRDAFDTVGRFPDWPLMEDVELMRRLRGRGRFVVLPTPLTVSARRWQKRGVVRQTLLNWSLLWRFYRGASPEELARHYRAVR